MSTLPMRFRRMLPTPQLIAEPIARQNPTTVRSPPTVKTMCTRPANATATPESTRAVGRSRSAMAANRIVKSA